MSHRILNQRLQKQMRDARVTRSRVRVDCKGQSVRKASPLDVEIFLNEAQLVFEFYGFRCVVQDITKKIRERSRG